MDDVRGAEVTADFRRIMYLNSWRKKAKCSTYGERAGDAPGGWVPLPSLGWDRFGGAGFLELLAVGGGPHGGGAFVVVDFVTANLAETIFHNPFPEIFILREQRPPFIQRRAIGQPALDGAGLASISPSPLSICGTFPCFTLYKQRHDAPKTGASP